MELPEALDATGLVCVVGAGGKKSTLYALADRLDRAVVTATVRIPIFDPHVASVVVTGDPVDAVGSAAADDWPLGVVPEQEREDRYRGYEPAVVDDLAAATLAPEGEKPGEPVDAILVKADGARMRDLKAPNDREPKIPDAASTVLPIASAHVVGQPLGADLVHRPELVGAITGLEPGAEIGTADVAKVIASDRGGQKGVPDGATVVPVINKVDDAELAATARRIAREVLARTDVPRVALARMTAEDPLVDVVE